MTNRLNLEDICFRHKDKTPIIIAGPCSAESEEQVLETAKQLVDVGCDVFRAGAWKPRTKPGNFEGFGEESLCWLEMVKHKTGMLVTTEVATPEHVKAALRHNIDILWIGARTTANPFAVQAIADALRGCDIQVLVKNPVNSDLDLWVGALERLNRAGIKRLAAIHRGFSLYGEKIYRNAPIWKIPIELHRRVPDLPIFCDPSHIGGKKELVAPLCQQAMDLCYDGLMVEVHCDPDKALSDAQQQITPRQFREILTTIKIRREVPADYNLTFSRSQINLIDEDLIRILANRMDVCHEIAIYKAEQGMSAFQSSRYNELLEKWVKIAKQYGLQSQFIKRLFCLIHEESVNEQMQILNSKEWLKQQ